MPKQVSEEELDTILQAILRFPKGGSIEDISSMMEKAHARRTLQRRLALLVEQKRLTIEGRGRGIRYRITANKIEGHLILPALRAEGHIETYVPISPEGEEIRKYVREP